jgi:hypothetical protein
MKRCCPETLVCGLMQMAQKEVAGGSIFVCRYLPTDENKTPLCALCVSVVIIL